MHKLDSKLNLKPTGKSRIKTQIILCHTSREVGEFLTSLQFRYNGKYNRIPNYVVTKEGEVIELISEKFYSNYYGVENIDSNSVFVCLENLGWLEKKPLTN